MNKDMSTTPKQFVAIKCPHCGYEYLPAELFIADDLVGTPESNGVVRDALGKILYVDWKEDGAPVLTTKYECDNCGHPFIVEAEISYKVRKEERELDFSEETVSLLD